MGPLRAALNAAAKRDSRIKKNESAWSDHLENLSDANTARRAYLDEMKIREFVAASYARNAHIGEFFEVLASSGARASQAARILVRDLQAAKHRLMMPKSGKGGSRDRLARKEQRYAVPISPSLAKRLAARARGKAPDDLLLTQPNGTPFGASWTYRDDVAAVAAAIGEPYLTLYWLMQASSACWSREPRPGLPRVCTTRRQAQSKVITRHTSPNLPTSTRVRSCPICRRPCRPVATSWPWNADHGQPPQDAPIPKGLVLDMGCGCTG
jgi:hypothetical protein